MLRRHPEVLTGVSALQVDLDGKTLWVIATDLNFARRHLANIGAIESKALDLQN